MYKSLWIGIRIPSVYISLLWFVCVYITLNMAGISRLIYRLICAAVTLLSTASQFFYYRMILPAGLRVIYCYIGYCWLSVLIVDMWAYNRVRLFG